MLTPSIEGVDVKKTFTYPWTVNIPSSELDDTSKWVFRFVPSGSLSSFQQISSSIFLISQAGSTAPTESSSTTSTSQITTSSNDASNSFGVTPTSSALGSVPSSNSVSTSATPTSTIDVTDTTDTSDAPNNTWIVGLVIGSVGGVSLIWLAGFLLWRRKRRNVATPNGPEEEEEIGQLHSDHVQHPQELEHSGMQRPAELYSH
ncbi:hypothetical protein F4819DRAFT_485601 [Hypoxylon fuscum]|nr:hypothetical protein F4819DRAFT_485601 [Hypoxylon fuscum]